MDRLLVMNNISINDENALADLLKQTKPHLIVTEQELMNVEFGDVTITYTMRAGKVAKMTITQSRSWLADKNTP